MRHLAKTANLVLIVAITFLLAACMDIFNNTSGKLTDVNIQIHVANIEPKSFTGVASDVTDVKVEVSYAISGVEELNTTWLIFNVTSSIWEGSFTEIPIATDLTFTATAYNASGDEIFSGTSTVQVAVDGDTVTLVLNPVESTETVELPGIDWIMRPALVKEGETQLFAVQVIGQTGETLNYTMQASVGAGTFVLDMDENGVADAGETPAERFNGAIAMSKSKEKIYFLFEAATPNIYSDFLFQVGNSFFAVSVEYDVTIADITSSDLSFVYSPTVTGIVANWTMADATNGTVTLTATTSDEDDSSVMTFDWTYQDGEVPFTFDSAVGNTAVLSFNTSTDYPVKLTVTDTDLNSCVVEVTITAGTFQEIIFQDFRGADGISIFTNDTYSYLYDSSTSWVERCIVDLGYTNIETFSGVDVESWADAFIRNKIVFVPYLDANLASALTTEARQAIAQYVQSGGKLVVTGPLWNSIYEFLNPVFSFDLNYNNYWNTTFMLDTAAASGTTFNDDPASISAAIDTYTLHNYSLPTGSKIIYGYDDGNYVHGAVVLIPYGSGWIIHLGAVFYEIAPNGSYDGGWTNILQSVLDMAN